MIFTSNHPMEYCFIKVKRREIIIDSITNQYISSKEELESMKRRMIVINKNLNHKSFIVN